MQPTRMARSCRYIVTPLANTNLQVSQTSSLGRSGLRPSIDSTPCGAGAMSKAVAASNPYARPGAAGKGRQTFDTYEQSNLVGHNRSAVSPKARSPPKSTTKSAREPVPKPLAASGGSPTGSPPKASPPKASPPKASPPKASSAPPKPPPPTPPRAHTPPPAAPPAAPSPSFERVDPEVHELHELFASPPRPEMPTRKLSPPSRPAPPTSSSYTDAWKSHLAASPRSWKPVSATATTNAERPSPTNHVRHLVSRFGGMQERGSSNFVPPQPRDAESPRLSPESVRAYVNQTGGSRTGSTNHTRLREEPSFRSRSQPTGTVVSPGVPGYMGHVPHGVGREAHVVEGRTDHVAKFDDFSSRPHKAIDQDREHIPRKMPPPGYAGPPRHAAAERHIHIPYARPQHDASLRPARS